MPNMHVKFREMAWHGYRTYKDILLTLRPGRADVLLPHPPQFGGRRRAEPHRLPQRPDQHHPVVRVLAVAEMDHGRVPRVRRSKGHGAGGLGVHEEGETEHGRGFWVEFHVREYAGKALW